MKVLTTSLILLILQVGIAHGSIIVGNTDVPTSVLFNFQVDEANEMALLIPPVYESWQDPSFFITAATASAPPPPSGTATPTPWLDDPVDNRPGGLGVCRTTDCAGIPDDNFNMGESVLLEINQPILVGDIYFRNGQHFLVFDPEAEFGVAIDGGPVMIFSLMSVFTGLQNTVINSNIEFSYVGQKEGEEFEFYVAGFGAPVPLPAALPLFLAGLLGLMGFKKRQR